MDDTLTIAGNDRGLLYGDGFFTTLAVSVGQPELWSGHLARLQSCAARLFFPAIDWSGIERRVYEQARSLEYGVVKIVISRGTGSRGYGTLGADTPSIMISGHEFPGHYADWQEQGISMGISPVQLARQPLLAGMKHLNRLEQVLVRHQLQNQGFDDVLVTDTEGMIVEASMANLLWYRDGGWFTPDLHYCGVEGVMRNHLVAQLALKDISVTSVLTGPEALLDADAVCVCNSLMHVVPIRQIWLSESLNKSDFDLNAVRKLQPLLGDLHAH